MAKKNKNNAWIVAGSVLLLAVVLYLVYSYSGLIKTAAFTSSTNINAKITISEVFNTKQGDTTPKSFFGNGDQRGSGESFPLVTKGKVVTDSTLPKDVEGLSVQRGDGFIKVSMDSRRTKGKEGASGTVTIEGATFTSITSAGRPERVDDRKKREEKLGKVLRDEAILVSSNQARFTLTSGPKIDTFTIFYTAPTAAAATATPTSTPIANAPQCSNGIDDDNDGSTDLADFSCQNNANHNDEKNPKSACQDGVDDDKDGLTDMDDPGCSGRQDNDETNTASTPVPTAVPAKVTKTTCIDQNGNTITTTSNKNVNCNNMKSAIKNVPVPVTAKTGPTEVATIAISTLLSGSGLAYALKKYLK